MTRVWYIIKDSRGHWGSEKWNNLSRIPSYCNVTPFFFSLKTVFSAVPYWFGIVVLHFLHFWHISQFAERFHSTCTTDQFTAPTTGLFIFIVINTILSFPLSRWECWRLVACEWLSGAAYLKSGLIFIPFLSITSELPQMLASCLLLFPKKPSPPYTLEVVAFGGGLTQLQRHRVWGSNRSMFRSCLYHLLTL